MAPLSDRIRQHVAASFDAGDRAEATRLLEERCGESLPFCSGPDREPLIERIRTAIVKLSGGELAGLRSALDTAEHDWRDTLVAAGFAEDPRAHEQWEPDPERGDA